MFRIILAATLIIIYLDSSASAHIPDRCQSLTSKIQILVSERLVAMHNLQDAAKRMHQLDVITSTTDLMEIDGRFFAALTGWVDCIQE